MRGTLEFNHKGLTVVKLHDHVNTHPWPTIFLHRHLFAHGADMVQHVEECGFQDKFSCVLSDTQAKLSHSCSANASKITFGRYSQNLLKLGFEGHAESGDIPVRHDV